VDSADRRTHTDVEIHHSFIERSTSIIYTLACMRNADIPLSVPRFSFCVICPLHSRQPLQFQYVHMLALLRRIFHF
jgi:hypothetical protein